MATEDLDERRHGCGMYTNGLNFGRFKKPKRAAENEEFIN